MRTYKTDISIKNRTLYWGVALRWEILSYRYAMVSEAWISIVVIIYMYVMYVGMYVCIN